VSLISSRGFKRLWAAVGAVALTACSVQPPMSSEDPRAELTGVPYFPQTIHECGPAALATVLNYSAATTTPEGLASEVYIPGRRGSLQVELMAASRRHARLPFVIEPDVEALRAEVAAGLPVLVLQDLGIAGIRRWHYAVVVGYEPLTEVYILRSGTERRRHEPARRFSAGWERAGRWGMIVLPPGTLPATATAETYTRALSAAAGRIPAVDVALNFDAAVKRWGDSATLLFAAANNAYASSEVTKAEAFYRQVLALDAGQVVARNNLAMLLLDRGCVTAGQREADLALRLAPADSPFLDALGDTNWQARSLQAGSDPAECSNQ